MKNEAITGTIYSQFRNGSSHSRDDVMTFCVSRQGYPPQLELPEVCVHQRVFICTAPWAISSKTILDASHHAYRFVVACVGIRVEVLDLGLCVDDCSASTGGWQIPG